MKIKDDLTKPEVIKLATEAYAITGGSPEKLVLQTVEWLADCYSKTGDGLCQESVFLTVKAYSEMVRSLNLTFMQIRETLGRCTGVIK